MDLMSKRKTRPVVHAFTMTFLVLSLLPGCRLCCEPDTEAFPAYGGVWERTQRNSGRVGSILDPGGVQNSALLPREQANKINTLQLPESPEDNLMEGEGDSSKEGTEPETEQERDRKFEERRKRFEQEQMEEIDVIPGTPLPPDIL